MNSTFRNLFLLFTSVFLLSACGQGEDQISGIVGQAQFQTIACETQTQIINVRNDDTSEPQRIQGVYFEMGTNNKNKFRIDKVSVGSVDYPASASMIEEVIIPAGGVMNIQVTYKPRSVTASGTSDTSYLDVFLNGPKLGIIQVKLMGNAPTAADGCGEGEVKSFKVTRVELTIKDGQGVDVPQTPITNITELFKFTFNGTAATITKDDFPSITIQTPDSSVEADLIDDTFDGTFENNSLTFENIIIHAAIFDIPDIKLTTGSARADQGPASVSLNGLPLANHHMELVLAIQLPRNAALRTLSEGVLGAKLYLDEQSGP